MFKLKANSLRRNDHGFTIVELLVVIVVIGVLAAITIVSYTGISQRANLASAQSDLLNATTQLKSYYTIYGAYPILDSNNCPVAPSTVDNNYCLKVSSGNALTYSIDHNINGANNYDNFGLSIKSSNNTYLTNNASDLRCPSNFIPVPGSVTYDTNDFCVMKYVASRVGTTNTPISSPTNLPWVNISQTTAIANSQNVDGCAGCHLTTEAEWMTIAQNVLSVASNWSGGAVGSGFIYSGHNDNSPANAIASDPSDTNGYASTGNITGSNQRRTLTLTNGEVIWDLAGNVWEWTSGVTNGTTAQQPGVPGTGYNYREWTALTVNGTLPVNSSPNNTGLTGANTWDSSKGIGQLYSNSDDSSLNGFLCGGDWGLYGSHAGVLSLALNNSPNNTGSDIGFRVSR